MDPRLNEHFASFFNETSAAAHGNEGENRWRYQNYDSQSRSKSWLGQCSELGGTGQPSFQGTIKLASGNLSIFQSMVWCDLTAYN